MTRMTLCRSAAFVALCFCWSSSVLADSNNNDQQQNLRRRRRKLQAAPLDGRWKSTKLSQKQKAAMGLYPPPGEKWPDDPPELADPYPAGEGTLTVIDTVDEIEAEEEDIMEAEPPPPMDDGSDASDDMNEYLSDPVEDQFMQDEDENLDPSIPKKYRRGTFLRYEPSKWEKGWSQNIDELVSHAAICRTLLHGKHQTARTHDFMDLLCMGRLEGDLSNWCYYHDHTHFMWYDSANRNTFDIYIDTTPMALEGIDPPPLEPVDYSKDEFAGVASKMIYKDDDTGEEYVEYIEPLVAQLKFPLAECLSQPSKPLLADFASFVLPPPAIAAGRRTLLYDVGSPDWSRLEYIVEEWGSRGAQFEFILSYASSGNEVDDGFLTTLPEEHESHVFRNYFQLVDNQNSVTSPSKVFVPVEIKKEAQEDDYVLLKLDRTPAKMKEAYVQYILDNHIHVDELIWEFNAQGNYVMTTWMEQNVAFDEISSMSLADAYGWLTKLRERGIRAHSWI